MTCVINMAKATEEKKERARIGLFQKQLSEAFRASRFEEMRKLVDENLEMVRTTTERGVITMTLRLAIQQRDEELILMLVDRLSMKRDYIELMIYKGDPAYNSQLFEAHIDTALLESKDIKLLVDHGMTYLFRYLDGKFLHLDPNPDMVQEGSKVDKSSILRRYALPDCDHYIQKITSALDSSPKNKTKSHLAVIDQIRTLAIATSTSGSSGYDVIIDGGNVLHARNGQPNPEDLNRMITMLQSRGHSPIVIIHMSHTDVSRSRSDHVVAVRNIFEARKVQFIATPYGLNDDLFILLAYLMRVPICGCSIVTRDTYTDHMDAFKNPQKNVSDDFGKHLAHDLVSFTVSDAYRQMYVPDVTPKPYTSCIQVVGTRVYIPLIAAAAGSEFAEIRME
jgi:hypothetical protein